MQFTIVGAGALGTILGAHLVAAGHGVTMVARGARKAQLEADGLVVTGLRDVRQRCAVVAPGAPVADTGIAIFTVKTYQMAEALAALGHLRPQAVFSVANGVLKNEQLRDVYGAATVLGCMANVSGELRSDGVVEFTRNVRLAIGPLAAYAGPAAQDVAAAIDGAGVISAAANDIETVEWSKYVGWLAMFTLAVLARTTTGVYLENAHLAALGVKLVREAAAVAAARGVALVDQSPLPVVTVSTRPEADAVAAVREIGRNLRVQAPTHRMSALQDLEAGRALEVHETLGYAVAEAARLGVAAPTLALCYGIVAGLNALPR